MKQTKQREVFSFLRSLKTGTIIHITVTSRSMEPTLHKGQSVLCMRQTISRIQTGDIVTFYVPSLDILVTHRVIQIFIDGRQYKFISRGDLCKSEDPWIIDESLLVGVIHSVK